MKNLYKRIRYYLIEMPDSKRDIETDVRQSTGRINEHLLKCLLIQDTTHNLNHWSDEVYELLSDVPKMKGNNKLPSEKMLYNCTIGYFGDFLYERLDGYIEDISEQEHTDIVYSNKQIIYDCIMSYYKWLIPILSHEGSVKQEEIKSEINKLIQQYNATTKQKEKAGV